MSLNIDGTHGPRHITDRGFALQPDRSQVVEEAHAYLSRWKYEPGSVSSVLLKEPEEIIRELARQLEQVEAERKRLAEYAGDAHRSLKAGRYEEAAVYLDDIRKQLRRPAALHPKERDDG
jgi:hypothetical protein